MMTKNEAKARLRPSRFSRFADTNLWNMDVKFLMIVFIRFMTFPDAKLRLKRESAKACGPGGCRLSKN
jgi:hypothetical protein